MPPNAKGGKAYKKKKKGGDEQQVSQMIDRQEGQLVGRVIRLLGNRNVLTYCQDNRLRVCHIRGKMKGRDWVEPGDLVLVSIREFEQFDAKTDKTDDRKGDILAKYANDLHGKLRREPGMNQKLFMRLETMEGVNLESVGVDKTAEMDRQQEDDCGFLIESDHDEDEESEENDDKEEKKISRAHAASEKKTNTANTIVQSAKNVLKDVIDADDDIDIDAI